VASTGVLVSASTLGTPSQGWRFPARNHIIAALAEVVLVVESRETGGSMVTAELALERGAMVMAVPGSVRNPAAAGTNRLISEGAAPACDPADVLTALSLTPALGVSRRTLLDGADAPADADDGADAAVLDVLDDEPKTLAAVIERTGLPPGEVVAALTRLELQSRAITERGWWQRSRSGNRR
jgi:DNA processing protein